MLVDTRGQLNLEFCLSSGMLQEQFNYRVCAVVGIGRSTILYIIWDMIIIITNIKEAPYDSIIYLILLFSGGSSEGGHWRS